MSETMALESLAEQWLRSQGYWTQTRVPFKKRKGNSDLDVIGVNLQGRGRVVVIECKGWYGPKDYPTFTSKGKKQDVVWLCQKAKEDLKYFLGSRASKDRGIARVDEFRLVLPGYLPDGAKRRDMETQVKKRCRLPWDLRLFSVHEIIRDLQTWVKRDMYVSRKRYSDTSLEMLRWVWRSGGEIRWRNRKGE